MTTYSVDVSVCCGENFVRASNSYLTLCMSLMHFNTGMQYLNIDH